jgi:two-component system, chemotaxis family, sensor kinase CheA
MSEMEDQQILREFLIESNENLARLDHEMVELEKRPRDASLLASIFRTIHTIKGTCGFLGFEILEAISHTAESILSQVRAQEREMTVELVSIILESVDAIKQALNTIEATGSEGSNRYEDLCRRLKEVENVLEPADKSCTAPVGNTLPGTNVTQAPLANSGPDHAEYPHEKTSQGSVHAPKSASQNDRSGADESDVKKPFDDIVHRPSAAVSTIRANSTIRVDVGLLDRLMNLVGELVLTRNQILQFNARQEDQVFSATSQRLNLITSELQQGVIRARMQPIGTVWNRLPRVVRDLAAQCGKQIALEMEGADTELDKTILEAIKDPLTHIVRNCCDHGIERPEVRVAHGKALQGRLFLRAFHEGGHVHIEITDDGCGISGERVKQKAVERGLVHAERAAGMSEREAAQLIFLPGLSTAQQVSNISGRGVGMDVVRTNIEKAGGVVDLTSERGSGTTVKIKLPFTLAIIPGLVVAGGGVNFVIPQVSLLELIRLEGEAGKKQIEQIYGATVYRHRGRLLPVVYLSELLQVSNEHSPADVVNIVVLQAEDCQFGLVVDGISDTQEIVVKPLGKLLKGVDCYAGATIMGDGKVALILDVAEIAQRSGLMSRAGESTIGNRRFGNRKFAHRRLTGRYTVDPRGTLTSLLLFQVGAADRLAVPLSLVARLEEFRVEWIERAAGDLVVQYRGRILPLLTLDGGWPVPDNGRVQVVVFDDGERQTGLIVDRIVDIVEECVTVAKKSGRPGILGSAVVGQKVTDFLDLDAVLFQNRGLWGRQARLSKQEGVLVADAYSFSRGLVRSYLEMEGHVVFEATDVGDALDRMLAQPVSLVLAGPELPGGGGQELLHRVRANSTLSSIPVAVLAASTDEADKLRQSDFAYDAYPVRTDRQSVLESIRCLAGAVELGVSLPDRSVGLPEDRARARPFVSREA